MCNVYVVVAAYGAYITYWKGHRVLPLKDSSRALVDCLATIVQVGWRW